MAYSIRWQCVNCKKAYTIDFSTGAGFLTMSIIWSWRESNPRPDTLLLKRLRS